MQLNRPSQAFLLKQFLNSQQLTWHEDDMDLPCAGGQGVRYLISYKLGLDQVCRHQVGSGLGCRQCRGRLALCKEYNIE